MLRYLVKTFRPVRISASRCTSGGGGGGAGADDTGAVGASGQSAYERNRVSKEEQLSERLRRALPGATYVSVHDVSGGCGAMYEISVEAREFAGLGRVAQHRLVTDSLKAEIRDMHGVRIHTAVPPDDTQPHS